jgi:hypothetical protein
MSDSPSDRLRALIQNYLAGAVDFVGLWDGFFAMLPDLHEQDSTAALALADHVMARLMDYDEGDAGPTELRASLEGLVEPPARAIGVRQAAGNPAP